MKTLLIALTLAASPVAAGGPVIVAEEPLVAEARPSSEGRWVVPLLIIVGAAVLIGSGGGSDVCQGPDDVPPTDGGC